MIITTNLSGETGDAHEPVAGVGLEVVYRRAFVVSMRPWRCAWVNLLDDADSPVGAEADELDPGSGDYLDIRGMLDPSPLSKIVELADWPAMTVPSGPLEADFSVLPGLVELGSDHYEVEFHPDLGIITSWTAVIRGVVAAQTTVEPTWWI